MARGTIAKEQVEAKIKEAFGADYAGTFDKKLYVWANDGGERVQIAISMTCPKTTLGVDVAAEVSAEPQSSEITPEEKANIENIMERLGL